MSVGQQTAQRKTKPNFLYAIASTALVLFLLGTFGMVLMFAHDFIQYYKERLEIMVEMKDEADEAATATFKAYIGRQAYVREGTLGYTTKQEAAEVMRKQFGDNFMAMGSNPLYNTLTFCVKAQQVQSDSLKNIAKSLKQNSLVSDVFYQEAYVNNISTSVRNIGLVTLFMCLVFLFIAANLIHNTVKLSLYSNRFLIKNMQLVGANWDFITRPYLMTSYKNGFLSAVAASLALGGLLLLLNSAIPELTSVQDPIGITLIFIVVFAAGILISGWSTRRCVNKYLRLRLEDLY
jgi:cell division transport system permease protein